MSKVQLQRRDRFVRAQGVSARNKGSGSKERSAREESQKKQTATERYFLAQTKSEALKL